jgi:hypothetical protein
MRFCHQINRDEVFGTHSTRETRPTPRLRTNFEEPLIHREPIIASGERKIYPAFCKMPDLSEAERRRLLKQLAEQLRQDCDEAKAIGYNPKIFGVTIVETIISVYSQSRPLVIERSLSL